MRRDGDRLLAHVAGAGRRVLLCAPFVKVGVLGSLLRAIPEHVTVEVATRWLPAEVAVGVSDLEVFDCLAARPGATLTLLDRLHAKLYLADDRVLAGSANLTAPALGWSSAPNLELLTELARTDPAVEGCLAQLAEARVATAEERDRVRGLAAAIAAPRLDFAADVEFPGPPVLWLPRTAAPARLFQAYVERTRERVASSVLEAALDDLAALAIPGGLTEPAFRAAVAEAFRAMPAVERILRAAADDLRDAEGVEIIRGLSADGGIPPEARWRIVQDWLTYFMGDRYEIAPQSFVVRLRPGAAKRA